MLVAAVLPVMQAAAAVHSATPANYRLLLSKLRPGDTLELAAGTYDRLPITGLRGTADGWITIQGPAVGAPAVIAGRSGYNTVELVNASHLALKNLRIDSRGRPGAFGLSAKDGAANRTHDIVVENCTFVGQNGSQQTVAISTKTPTWNWIIRRNVIEGAGTGLYLGMPDGTMPFVAGRIEGNLIKDTIGYNAEIKFQRERPALDGMPAGPSRTVIRHNVFIKSNAPCGSSGCRPNLLLGGFPDSGSGSEDMYEVYGNLFYNNPYEALLQASGRIAVHDNLFINAANQTAIVLRHHDLPLKVAHVYRNTVYTPGRGIHVGTAPLTAHSIVSNLLFAKQPISGYATEVVDNLTDTLANAGRHVSRPSMMLGAMDFRPVAARPHGAPLDLSAFAGHEAHDRDFDGQPRDSGSRGAYGSPAGKGWMPSATRKPMPGHPG